MDSNTVGFCPAFVSRGSVILLLPWFGFTINASGYNALGELGPVVSLQAGGVHLNRITVKSLMCWF